MDDDASSTSSDDVASSSEDDEAEDLQDADSARDEDDEALAGTSGITLGQGDFKARRIRDRERRRDERKLEKEERRRTEEAGEERIKVGEVVWVALEIAFHGDGWGKLQHLSSPCAQSSELTIPPSISHSVSSAVPSSFRTTFYTSSPLVTLQTTSHVCPVFRIRRSPCPCTLATTRRIGHLDSLPLDLPSRLHSRERRRSGRGDLDSRIQRIPVQCSRRLRRG